MKVPSPWKRSNRASVFSTADWVVSRILSGSLPVSIVNRIRPAKPGFYINRCCIFHKIVKPASTNPVLPDSDHFQSGYPALASINSGVRPLSNGSIIRHPDHWKFIQHLPLRSCCPVCIWPSVNPGIHSFPRPSSFCRAVIFSSRFSPIYSILPSEILIALSFYFVTVI